MSTDKFVCGNKEAAHSLDSCELDCCVGSALFLLISREKSRVKV